MITRYFTLDGESSAKYGIAMQGPPSFSAPKPKITKVSVSGRSGDLIFAEDAFENIQGILRCFILHGQSYDTIADANIWLAKTGYRKLTFDGDDLAYRLACVTNVAECAVRMYYLDPFEIELDCKPQRYLNSGDVQIMFSASGTFDCPAYSGLPLLRIYGTSGTVTINEKTITLLSISTYVDVDCELQDAYKENVNCNGNISCTDFPKLRHGQNNITISSGITSVVLTPRWFTI